MPQQTTSQIPVATAPIDIRTKFNVSNGYNPTLDAQSETDVSLYIIFMYSISGHRRHSWLLYLYVFTFWCDF